MRCCYGLGFVLKTQAMKRRELLKAMSIMPITFNGMMAAGHVSVEKQFIIFVNENVLPARMFDNVKFPSGFEVAIVPIRIPKDQKIDDVIRLYKLTDS